MTRLIVTNGDTALESLRTAGIDGELLAWRDILHDGPVPAGLPLAALSQVRSRYLAGAFDLLPPQVQADFAERDAAIRDHGRHERIELWFEHDLVDQLQLIQLLDFFAAEGRTEDIWLVQADDYLGLQPPGALRALEGTRKAVTAQQFDTARQAWSAFTAPTPEPTHVCACADALTLPYLAPALHRLLHELPAEQSGLSLTEERILSALNTGSRTAGQLFALTQEQEDARFLGDSPFFQRLDGLGFAPTPLLAGLPFPSRLIGRTREGEEYRTYIKAPISSTEAGRAALGGRFDHARENKIDRWLGGTHLSSASLWRRGAGGRPILHA
jgi:hypothetical protein